MRERPGREGSFMPKPYAVVALKIAAIYGVIGCFWILFSDRAIELFTSDPAAILAISTAKGWVYVVATAALLYWLLRRYLAEIGIAEGKLKSSEEKFSKGFNYSPVLMTISAIDNGVYLEVNERFCQVSGFSREEAIGRTSVELGWITVADREELIALLRRDGRINDWELALTAKDGRKVTCLFSAALIVIEGEQRLLSIALDVTERLQNLAELHSVKECFDQALHGSQHVLYRLNVKQGCYDYLSPAFETITGHPLADFSKNGLETLKQFIHPDDRSRIFSQFDAAFQSRTGRSVNFDLEYRLRRGDGDYCWLHDSTTACFDANGELECFFGSAHDITDRKKTEQALLESEERYRRFSAITTDYVSCCRRSGSEPFRVQWLAGAVGEITGYSREQIIAWGCWMPLVHPEDLDRVKADLQSLRPGDTATFDFRIVRQDGAIRWIHEACHCESGAAPGELLLLGTSRDITERKDAETALLLLNEHLERLVRERTADLEQSNQELATFCYAVSHELRAPIARLQGFSTILAELCHDSAESAFVAARIDAASLQLQAVVDAILLLSRLSRMELNLQELDLSAMAQEQLAQLRAENSGRSLEVVIAPGIRGVADANLMQICLANLLGNACKYTGQTPAARIEFGVADCSGREVYFVRDNGAGFDMSYADKLYVPFQRLHQQEDFPGLGIGLATVKRIVDRHGGELWGESATGSGACFYFTLGSHSSGGGGVRS